MFEVLYMYFWLLLVAYPSCILTLYCSPGVQNVHKRLHDKEKEDAFWLFLNACVRKSDVVKVGCMERYCTTRRRYSMFFCFCFRYSQMIFKHLQNLLLQVSSPCISPSISTYACSPLSNSNTPKLKPNQLPFNLTPPIHLTLCHSLALPCNC